MIWFFYVVLCCRIYFGFYFFLGSENIVLRGDSGGGCDLDDKWLFWFCGNIRFREVRGGKLGKFILEMLG